MDLNTDQIKKMKQAICYERTKVRKGIYNAWRNSYVSGIHMDPDWEDLVRKKLAFAWMVGESRSARYWYSLTDEGIKTLSEILDIDIIEK